MARKNDIIDDLYHHCISDGNPTFHILENGKFPNGWVESYLELLEEASQLWRSEDYWPKKLVAAIHFTSFYLDFRYKAWCAFTKSRNVQTEDALAGIRVRSEFFLLDAHVQEVKENMPK
ncbi:MAG: hypothetical protein ACYTBJ_03330 [Planctomycetota bacterium]|jgi:hypothetical protein